MSYIDSKLDIYDKCDNRAVEGPIFYCDELIAPVIVLLNKKGYTTTNCCSGHLMGSYTSSYYSNASERHAPDNCYIAFDVDAKEIIDIIPPGFKLELAYDEWSDYKCLIRKRYRFGDEWIQILNTAKGLYNWAKSLPDREVDQKWLVH